jgi:hypothetical protein
MVFAHELQIGNFVLYKGMLKQVINFDQNGINFKPVIDYDLSLETRIIDMNYEALVGDLRPVKITSSILIKCGFIVNPSSGPNESSSYCLALPAPINGKVKTEIFFFMSDVFEVKPYGHISVSEESLNLTNNPNKLNHISKLFYSLHELQNIYFSFVGKPLIIKL